MAARSAPVPCSRVRLPSASRPLRAQPRPVRASAPARAAVARAEMAPYGFLGLGIMGEAMARNLLKLGAGVVIYNRSADKARARPETASRRTPRGAQLLRAGARADVAAARRSAPRW